MPRNAMPIRIPFRYSLYLFLALSLTSCWKNYELFGQSGSQYPTVFGTEAGLPGSSSITDLIMDQKGFLWLATTRGLCRFDGTATRLFQHNPLDTFSLSNNRITGLFYDSTRQELWVTTWEGGLNRMYLTTGRFKRFTHIFHGMEKVPLNHIEWIIKDRKGVFWTNCDRGLIEFHLAENDFRLHTYTPDQGER